jgi:glycosyltransferase involved in cell wall biosynthesis
VISLHRAEGFGFTPAVAMALGKPVIATRYSGNLDYMTDENSFLVDAPLTSIGPDGAPYPADGQWADPDLDLAARLMREVFEDRTGARARGDQAARDMAERHSPAVAGGLMRALLAERSGQAGFHAGARTRAWWMRRGRG